MSVAKTSEAGFTMGALVVALGVFFAAICRGGDVVAVG